MAIREECTRIILADTLWEHGQIPVLEAAPHFIKTDWNHCCLLLVKSANVRSSV